MVVFRSGWPCSSPRWTPPLYFLRALNAAFPVHRPPRIIASRGITAPR